MSEVWTVKRALDWTIQYFQRNQIPEPRLSAELLLAHVLGCRRIDLYLQFERILTPGERAQYRQYVQRRAQREPVQYIIGEAEFYGLVFQVTPAVLIPRPETELLVDQALEAARVFSNQPIQVLDVGTGSGCIAIALARHLPRSSVWSVEASPAALEVAKANARQHGVQIHFVPGRFEQVYARLPGPFHLIVANPPYVGEKEKDLLPPEVRDFEPPMALFAGQDSLQCYRTWIPHFDALLHPRGTILVETGYNQSESVCQLFARQQFQTEVYYDYQNHGRVVKAWRPAAQPVLANQITQSKNKKDE